MKRKDLKPGMEVAVKVWGDQFNKGIVLDLGGWEVPYTWTRNEMKEVTLDSGATVKTTARRIDGSRKVLVEIISQGFNGEPQHRAEAVTLQSILGLYDEVKAARDRRNEAIRRSREAADARQRREEELRDHARARLAAFKEAHPSPATEMDPFDVTIAIKSSTLEHLLSIAEKAVE